MKKHSLTIVLLLMMLCAVLSLSLMSLKMQSKEPTIVEDNSTYVTDFDSLNYLKSFDVSDFTGTEENTIDIVSKNYTNDVISIADSDFKISDSLLSKIYSIVQNYGASTSFYIVSLEDGMSIGYNVDKSYETASSIKAPYALYIYEEIDKGNIDPNQKIVYEEKYYNKGTGVVKNSDFGTEFTVSQLLYYSLNDSDNVAHTMLHRNFGVNGYNEMLRRLGTKQLYLTASNPWGYTTCRSSALIWQEIYNFSIRSSYGVSLLNTLTNGKYNYYKEVMPNITSASKTGFANKDVIETGIVFGDHPYIGIAVANKGGNIGAYTQVLKLISAMNDIMSEYDEYLKNS